jgi:RimJ/RimL family protein N-acetyltransferase
MESSGLRVITFRSPASEQAWIMSFLLETERLRLRPFRAEDADIVFAYRNDPPVYRYQGWAVPYTREDVTNFLDRMSKVAFGTQGEWFQPAVELRTTGEVIGDVAFVLNRREPRQALIGYTLAQRYWNKGFASEAVRALINLLFRELKIHRIIADCDVENIASIRLLEKLGFRREAHYVESYWLGDRWGDEYQYALLEREWRG